MGQLLLLAAIFLIASQLSPKKAQVRGGLLFKPEPSSPLVPGTVTTSFEMGVPARGTREFNKWVQKSINTIMDYNLAVDGILGPRSKGGIIAFQNYRGLLADGIPGRNTEAEIIEALQTGTTYGD